MATLSSGYSYVILEGNDTLTYTFDFDYISKDHVFVFINDQVSTFTWVSANTIAVDNVQPWSGGLGQIPSSTDTVKIVRASSPSERLVNFAASGVLTEKLTDLDSDQQFYLNQESLDIAQQVLETAQRDLNTILHGSGAPNNSIGTTNDFYIDTLNDKLYGPKGPSAWSTDPNEILDLGGPQGPSGTAGTQIYYTSLDPSTQGSLGIDTDLMIYITGSDKFLYRKVGGVWQNQGNLTGATGVQGSIGPAGQGVPTGGTTGQILAKADNNDYNTEWIDAPTGGGGSGGGNVSSVNGEVGTVVLDADDIDDTSTTHKFATAAQLTKLDGLETYNLGTWSSSTTLINNNTSPINGSFAFVRENNIPQLYVWHVVDNAWVKASDIRVSSSEITSGTEASVRSFSPSDIVALLAAQGISTYSGVAGKIIKTDSNGEISNSFKKDITQVVSTHTTDATSIGTTMNSWTYISQFQQALTAGQYLVDISSMTNQIIPASGHTVIPIYRVQASGGVGLGEHKVGGHIVGSGNETISSKPAPFLITLTSTTTVSVAFYIMGWSGGASLANHFLRATGALECKVIYRKIK